jgi:hypothetical protein
MFRNIGCDRLAAIEENIVLAFTDVGGDDNNRISVILNRAYKVRGKPCFMNNDDPTITKIAHVLSRKRDRESMKKD